MKLRQTKEACLKEAKLDKAKIPSESCTSHAIG